MYRYTRILFVLALCSAFVCLSGCGKKEPEPEAAAKVEVKKEKPSLPEIEPTAKKSWKVTASGVQEDIFPASYACDGRRDTRWSSPAADPQWLKIDMGEEVTVVGMTIYWEAAFSSEYYIEVSLDGSSWQKVYEEDRGDGNTDDFYFGPVMARFVKIVGTKRGTGWGHSIWEVEIKGPDEQILVDTDTAADSDESYLFDGDLQTVWQSAGPAPCALKIDFQVPKTIGGMRFDWGRNYPTAMKMSLSMDGETWEQVGEIDEGIGKFDLFMHPNRETRYVKLDIASALKEKPVEIKEVSIRSADEKMTPLSIYQLAAEKGEPGYYPEHLRKRQTYWTLVGLPDDRVESLFDEYGNIEPKFGSSSLMPYIWTGDRLYSALDAERTQALEDSHLPLPSVEWKLGDLSVSIQAYARGSVTDSVTYARYTLKNNSEGYRTGRFYLTIRPVQINPKWQYGGLSPITSLEYHDVPEGKAVRINGEDVYIALTKPHDMAVRAFERGDIVEDLAQGRFPKANSMSDAGEFISGAMSYQFGLAPGDVVQYVVAMPLHGVTTDIQSFRASEEEKVLSLGQSFDVRLAEMKKFWRRKLDRVSIDIPDKHVIDTMKSQIAYILINRDGVAIQPGSRNYKRCWIRDGSLTAAALLRMGLTDEVKEYLEWYSARVRPNGWVPPILHNNGELDQGFGWDNEYDSQGQYIFIMMEYYRFTNDKEFLAKHFDKIVSALKYLIELRDQTLVEGYMADEGAPERFRGILPKSISHEGYSPPMHSYWDDFFALKGWKDGRDAAIALGREDIAKWAQEQYEIFRQSMLDSILATVEYKNIDYMPGCAEKGDADATSTAIAFFPCREDDLPPRYLVENIFDMYYRDLESRLKPSWVGGFTPYEIRSITAFVGLGQNDRAKTLLDFILSCRRPEKWNQLGEVVYSDERLGSYIGDMPHTWVGSGYVNSVRSMFAQEIGGRLVLLAGAPKSWFEDDGIEIKNLPTHFGKLDMKAKSFENRLAVNISGGIDAPEGLELHWPGTGKPSRVLVDDQDWQDYDEKKCNLPTGARTVMAKW